MEILHNISEYEIGKHYTFSPLDIDIINKHRRDYNRLGFALQLALLRYPGLPLSSINNIPDSVLNYIAEQDVQFLIDILLPYAQCCQFNIPQITSNVCD
jgi:TnpA family transposase